jgi:hypothetical protein
MLWITHRWRGGGSWRNNWKCRGRQRFFMLRKLKIGSSEEIYGLVSNK